MTMDDFELLFDAEVAAAAGPACFKRVGNSLYATVKLVSASLIRLSGPWLGRTPSRPWAPAA